MNFGFGGSEPQTLNLSHKWYGGISRSRGGGVWSCGERIFRLALSVPEIYDLKVLPFDLICIETGSGRGQMTSSPDRGRWGLQSLARPWYCGFAFRRYSTLNFLPISPNEKMSTCNLIFFYDRRKKNTIDGVCEIPWQFPNGSRHSSAALGKSRHVKCYSHHARTSTKYLYGHKYAVYNKTVLGNFSLTRFSPWHFHDF